MIKRFKTLLIALLFQSLSLQPVYASDDSCVQGVSLLNTLIANVTTLGLFTVYSSNFHIDGAPNGSKCDANYYGGKTHKGKSCAPTDQNCTSDCDPRGGMRVCYKTVTYSGVTTSNPTGLSYDYDCNEVQEGWSKTYTFPPATIRAKKVGDQLCAQFWTIVGYQSIGCKYLPDCSQFGLTSSCFVAKSCSDSSYQHSRSFIPIAGGIIQCIQDSVQNLFQESEGCTITGGGSVGGSYTPNYFPTFQNTVRNIISILLVLYVIFFGIKVALGGEVPSKGEFFAMGAKFLLVLYFSVGIPTGYDKQNQLTYDDGVTTILQPIFQNASTTLTQIVYSSGGSRGLCTYNTKDYPENYEYLALWDSIDCRLLYYLGIDQLRIQSNAEAGVAISIYLLGTTVATFASLFMAALFAFQIIFAVFCIIFMLFLLSIVIYLVNLTVISIIALAILTYLAPIFVPMALFEYTKRYFEGWLKLLISYALQPVIVAAFIALLLTIFDQTMFGNCTFTSSAVTWTGETPGNNGSAPTKSKPFFRICDPDNPTGGCTTSVTDPNALPCKQTIGYQITNSESNNTDNLFSSNSAMFFTITTLASGKAANMLPGLITLCLFAYLFYKFSEMLSDFAAELTGGTSLGSLAGRPMEFFDKAMAAIMSKMGGGKAGAGAGTSEATAALKGGGSSGASASTKRPET